MNISQIIDNFRPEGGMMTIAAGKHEDVRQAGRYFVLKSNLVGGVPALTEIQVAFGKSQHFTPWPVLFSFQTRNPEDFFDQVKFYNPSGSDMVLDFFISTDWIDNKSNDLTTSGALPVIDVSNTVTTHPYIVALPRNFLIDAGPAVNKGGGLVGIPVTANPFATGEIVTIAGTVNYDGVAYAVDATSGVNEVVITAAYVAEVFAGTETIGLTTPRSVAADAARKELIAFDDHSTVAVYWGDSTSADPLKVGTPILAQTCFIIPTTAAVYFMAGAGAGKTGANVWLNALRTI